MIAGLVRQLDSFTQVLGALGSDLTRPFAGERDWFEMRDPEYIRRTLPGMKPRSGSLMCSVPPAPWLRPVSRPRISASAFLGSEPRASTWP